MASDSARGDATAALQLLLDRAKAVNALKAAAKAAAAAQPPRPATVKGQPLAEAAAALCKQLAASSSGADPEAIAALRAELADYEAAVAAAAHVADAHAAAAAEEKAVVAEWAAALRTQLVDTATERTAEALLFYFESALRDREPFVAEPQDAAADEQPAAAPLPAPQQDDASPEKPSGWLSSQQAPSQTPWFVSSSLLLVLSPSWQSASGRLTAGLLTLPAGFGGSFPASRKRLLLKR